MDSTSDESSKAAVRSRAEADMRKLANYRMPFGKYKGTLLLHMPEAYFIWFSRKGFPRGELGRMMQIAFEMKVNGLDHLLDRFHY